MSNLLNRSLAGISSNDRRTPYSRPPPANERWQHDKFQESSNNAGNRPTNKLIVTGLHYEVNEEELNSLFARLGDLAKKPYIKYDKSGRSTGLAYVTYKSTTNAIEAKNEYDGAKAKGATISISFDQRALRYDNAPNNRGGAGADLITGRGGKAGRGGHGQSNGSGNGNGGDSLLGRLSGKDLLSRLGGEGAPSSAPKGPKSNSNQSSNFNQRQGPVRSVSGNSTRGGNKNSRGGSRGGRGGGGGTSNSGRKDSNKTAGDLDSELEAFMKAPPGSIVGSNGTEKSDHAPMDTD